MIISANRSAPGRLLPGLRRRCGEPSRPRRGKPCHAGPIELDEETRRVFIRGQELKLTPIEFGLLKVLLNRPDRVFPRNELISHVQGYEFEGYDRTIDTHIKNLRKKIAVILADEEIILIGLRVGYKLRKLDN